MSYNLVAEIVEFGLGWNVGIPNIQRKTEKELPLYRDADESDTFIIAGAEDLVPEMVEITGVAERVIITNGTKIIFKRARP
ncbi:MAG: hypothetical protein IPJ39_22760 [Saprospiraceae bacterium]|nr:hypothetical protein [Saprospiraceae bacterium]